MVHHTIDTANLDFFSIKKKCKRPDITKIQLLKKIQLNKANTWIDNYFSENVTFNFTSKVQKVKGSIMWNIYGTFNGMEMWWKILTKMKLPVFC